MIASHRKQDDMRINDICGSAARQQLADLLARRLLDRNSVDSGQRSRQVDLSSPVAPYLGQRRRARAHGKPLTLCHS